MQEHVLQRIDALIASGISVIGQHRKEDYWMRDVVAAQNWFSSAANTIQQIAPPGSFYAAELARIVCNEQLTSGFPHASMQKLLGLLQSVQQEAKSGLLVKLEDQVVATTFDDFIDHAVQYHKSGKVKESSVLASAVLEDTLKRIATKAGVSPKGFSLEPLIDELTKAGVFSAIKSKRIKSFSAVRNHALHAEWEQIDLKDVGALLSGLRELLTEHL
jgi:hypothetical protein